ncbi:hypothetical protein IC620_09095 [Hazenella sp. IB182357]|uniref:Uncharacterized protein n=1 Tax=Polycladospora coralii TaxID=2771432 RepID=A0A926RT86_9BACL|nr:hypothetical protein [Polycladospora coralii]MBD1372510.1 hypothetical protein [Polycladospora coralii]
MDYQETKLFFLEQMPRKGIWLRRCHLLFLLFMLFGLSIIGIPIALLILPFLTFCVWKQSRYPIDKVICPSCTKKLRIEPDVKEFHCFCSTYLVKDENNQVVKYSDYDYQA